MNREPFQEAIAPVGLLTALLGIPDSAAGYDALSRLPVDQLKAIASQSKQNADTAFSAIGLIGKLQGYRDSGYFNDHDYSVAGWSVEFLVELGMTLREISESTSRACWTRSAPDGQARHHSE